MDKKVLQQGGGGEQEECEAASACPICFCHPTKDHPMVMVTGPSCHKNHAFCQSCIERVLLAPPRGDSYDGNDDEEETMVSSSPTVGRCPICRTPLRLFELVLAKSQEAELAYEKDHDVVHSQIGGRSYVLDGGSTAGETLGLLPGGLMVVVGYHFPGPSSLPTTEEEEEGCTGATTTGSTDVEKVGLSSDAAAVAASAAGHTDLGGGGSSVPSSMPAEEKDVTSEETAEGKVVPYITYQTPTVPTVAVDEEETTTPPPPPSPRTKYFVPESCHYHEKTRTFHGTVLWNQMDYEDGGSATTFLDLYQRWEYIMQFSTDYRYVCGGCIVMHHHHTSSDSSTCPLDGKWRVKWCRHGDDSTEGRINVVSGCFSLYGIEYFLNVSNNNNHVSFTWPPVDGYGRMVLSLNNRGGVVVTQRAVSGVDLINGTHVGPPIGGMIVWTTTDPDYPRIEWTRETVGGGGESLLLPPKTVRFGPSPWGLIYIDADATDERARTIAYHGDTVWGNVYVQGLKVGLASYHFISENGGSGSEGGDAYICYEHPLCALWPRLDDGSSVPARVPFDDVEWDAPARTFRGVIHWQGRYGTTWQGCGTWRYSMVFDSEFVCIVSGTVLSSRGVGEAEVEMSRFGESLIYVNAAAGQRLGEMLVGSSQRRVPVSGQDQEGENQGNHEEVLRQSQETGRNGGAEDESEQEHNDTDDDETLVENMLVDMMAREGGGEEEEVGPDQDQADGHGEDPDEPHTVDIRAFADASLRLSRRLRGEGASRRTMMLLQGLLEAIYEMPAATVDTISTDYLEALRRSSSRRSRAL